MGLAVVNLLVGAGADLDVRNLEDQTASDIASTDEVRKAIAKGKAKMDGLLQTILAGAGTSSSSAESGTDGLSPGMALLAATPGMDLSALLAMASAGAGPKTLG